MKKGERYTGVVERMEFPNRGIVMIDGERAIVKNALPGQEVTFAVNKKRGGRCEGRLLEVVKESPLETEENRCPHFGICGGCVCQSIPYEEQLKIKEQQIKTLLDSVCQDYVFEGIKGSPIHEGYRNKMEFSFGDQFKDGPLALGMHKKNSFHDIVTVDNCKIVDRDYNIILRCVLDYCAKKELPFYHKLRHEGYVRHLLVRRTTKTKELLVALVTTSAIVAPSIASMGASPVLVGLAICFGSVGLSLPNDSGFWVINRFAGFTLPETIKGWTINGFVAGLAGLVVVIILSFFNLPGLY